MENMNKPKKTQYLKTLGSGFLSPASSPTDMEK